MKFKVINLQKVSFSLGKINEENINGTVEVTSDKIYTNYIVLMPIEWLVEQNEENRKRNITEWNGSFAIKMRYIIELSKKESEKAFLIKYGEVLEIKRNLAGINKVYKLEKI